MATGHCLLSRSYVYGVVVSVSPYPGIGGEGWGAGGVTETLPFVVAALLVWSGESTEVLIPRNGVFFCAPQAHSPPWVVGPWAAQGLLSS